MLHYPQGPWRSSGLSLVRSRDAARRLHDTDKLVSMPIRFDLIESRDPAAVRSTVHRNTECRLGLRRIECWDAIVPFSHFRCAPCSNDIDRRHHLETGRILAAYAVSFQLPPKNCLSWESS